MNKRVRLDRTGTVGSFTSSLPSPTTTGVDLAAGGLNLSMLHMEEELRLKNYLSKVNLASHLFNEKLKFQSLNAPLHSFLSSQSIQGPVFENKLSSGRVGISEFYLEKCKTICKECGMTSYKITQVKDKASCLNRCNQWTERENVFLTGIILEQYYRRHSLKPTKLEKEDAAKNGESSTKLIWKRIHEAYEVACVRFYRLTGMETPTRTIEALQKHWKETGKRRAKEDAYQVPDTKKFQHLWDEKYNSYHVLTCPGMVFESALEVLQPVGGGCCCMKGNLMMNLNAQNFSQIPAILSAAIEETNARENNGAGYAKNGTQTFT